MSAYNKLDPAIAGLKYGSMQSGEKIVTYKAAEQINFGVPVFGYSGDNINVYNAKRDTAVSLLDADLVTSNVYTLTINGTDVATTFDTDHDTTMDAVKANIETAFPSATVTLTDATNNREVTIFQAGTNFTVTGVVTLGGSQAGVTVTYTTAQVFLGVSVITHKAYTDSVGYYVQYDAVNVMEYGELYVNTAAAVNANTDAYVVWNLTSDQGKFTATSTNNYAVGCKFKSTITAAGLAVVEVRGQQIDATP